MIKNLTDTAYSTGMSTLSPAFRGTHYAVLACGDNLDAPSVQASGGLFWGNLVQEAIPAIASPAKSNLIVGSKN
jgi:hypothetical protein